jgi:hypothetical protein
MTSRKSRPPQHPPTRRKPRRILARIGAAAFSVGMLTAISLPASAATTRSAAPDSPAVATTTAARNTPNTPDTYRWVFINYFETSVACNNTAQLYEENYIPARCELTQEYDLVVWGLWVQLKVS